MITTAKIIKSDGKYLLIEPADDLSREIERQKIEQIELRLDDGRTISSEQRRKIFALIRDISLWSGHEPEELRALLTWNYRLKANIDDFSLSDVDMTTAKEFITYLINFCFAFDVPTKDTLLNQTDDIGKYLYMCLEYRKCAVCNKYAEVHHVDRIGMGRNREHIVHVGLRAIALCHEHHTEVHATSESEFFEYHHIYGIKLDEYLCKRLSLRTKKRGT